MVNIVRYNGDGTNFRGPSPALWGDLGEHATNALQGKCLFQYDDFAEAPAVDNTAATQQGERVKYYCDNGCQIAGADIAAGGLIEAQGELQVSGNDADNDEAHIVFGTSKNYWIDNSSNNTGELLIEFRVKVGSVADSRQAFFVGLTSETPAADGMTDNAGALATDSDWIGFRQLQADGDSLDFVFQAANQTLNTVIDGVHTLVADDYVKVGYHYRPRSADPTKRIAVFLNGVEQSTYVGDTDIDAATFPEAVALFPGFFTKVNGTNETNVTLDWYAVCQYGDSGASN